ncbi:hypothetical protein [Streptomyces sp. NBC_01506]
MPSDPKTYLLLLLTFAFLAYVVDQHPRVAEPLVVATAGVGLIILVLTL